MTELDDSGTNMKFLKEIAEIICQKYPFQENDKVQMVQRKHEVSTFFNVDQTLCVFSYSGIAVFNNTSNMTGILLNHNDNNFAISGISTALITISSILLVILLTSATLWLIHRQRQKKSRKLCIGCEDLEKSKLRPIVRYTEEVIVINRHTSFHDTI